MDHLNEIVKRLEEENGVLKNLLSQLEVGLKKCRTEFENDSDLAESECIFRNIFENSIDGILLIGANNVIKEWNRGLEDMLGISKEEAIGKNLWDVFNLLLEHDTYSKEEIEELRNQLNIVISRGQQTNFVRRIVNLQTHQERTIHTLYFPVYHSNTYTLCIICRDITINVNWIGASQKN